MAPKDAENGKLNGWSKWVGIATGLAGTLISALIGVALLLWQSQTMAESFRKQLRENDQVFQRELRESDSRYIEARFKQREEIEQRRENDANNQLKIMLDIRQREIDSMDNKIEKIDKDMKNLHSRVLEYDTSIREELLGRIKTLREEIAKLHASPSPGGGE